MSLQRTKRPALALAASVAIVLTIVWPAGRAFALASDRDQAAELEAGRTVYVNRGDGYTQLTGGVSFKQGSLEIDAEQARLFGRYGQEITRIVVEGDPAVMSQKLDGEPGVFTARAKKIVYDLAKDQLTFTGSVVINQYRGELQSERVVYDLVDDRIDTGSIDAGDGSRVRMRIEPDNFK